MRWLCSVGAILGMALTGGTAAQACGGCGCCGASPAYRKATPMPPMNCCGVAAIPAARAPAPKGGAMPGMDMAGAKRQAVKTQRITVAVTGMHCDDCAAKVRKALASVPGVKQVLVDLDRGEALVVVEAGKFNERAMQAAVREAGYGARMAK